MKYVISEDSIPCTECLPAKTNLKHYVCVDKHCFDTDPYHAPFREFYCSSRGEAKSKYLKAFPDYKYVDIICKLKTDKNFLRINFI